MSGSNQLSKNRAASDGVDNLSFAGTPLERLLHILPSPRSEICGPTTHRVNRVSIQRVHRDHFPGTCDTTEARNLRLLSSFSSLLINTLHPTCLLLQPRVQTRVQQTRSAFPCSLTKPRPMRISRAKSSKTREKSSKVVPVMPSIALLDGNFFLTP